jgi:hypothetical protein
MFAGPDTPLVRHTENGNDFEDLCQVVQAAGGNMFTQHNKYALAGCPADTNIEVITGWGNYIDPADTVHKALNEGHRLGFVATSDGHRRNPGTGGGLTGIYAPELTPEAVLAALKNRKNYATAGTKLFLDARASGAFMGEEVTVTGPVELSLRADAPRTIVKAVLVRDGEEIHTVDGEGSSSLSARYEDRAGTGLHWYYWRVELTGQQTHYRGNVAPARGKFGWTSPHWVTVQ